jgi:hypothetical protein
VYERKRDRQTDGHIKREREIVKEKEFDAVFHS